jgi:hypothetical protein
MSMTTWRTLAALIITLGVALTARSQTYCLKEAPLTGSYFHLQLHMSLKGELKIRQENKVNPLKQEASAEHDFLERILDADESGPARKAARVYKVARAEITTADQTARRTLRPELASLMVAQCYKEQPLVYSPKGALSREELDLMQHFDTLHLPGLLPARDVAIGATWKIANGTAQALCSFDGLSSHDLAGKLEEVKANTAVVSITGTASGIDLGASVKLKINAQCHFDLASHRIVSLQWKQHDERDQGPASPALEADLTFSLQRDPIDPADELNDLILALVSPGQAVEENLTALRHHDPRGRYDLTYGRDWQVVARTDEYLVLRLLDRGDFVAQATLTWWKPASPGQHLSPEEFKEAMAQARDWTPEKTDGKEVEAPKGNWLYRVESLGQLNGVRTQQYFYLLAGPQGQQLVLTFTLTPSQIQKLAARDLTLVRGVTFPEASTTQADGKSP